MDKGEASNANQQMRFNFKSAKAFDESNMKWGAAKKSSVPDLFLGNLVSYATKIIISRKEIDLQKKYL